MGFFISFLYGRNDQKGIRFNEIFIELTLLKKFI